MMPLDSSAEAITDALLEIMELCGGGDDDVCDSDDDDGGGVV